MHEDSTRTGSGGGAWSPLHTTQPVGQRFGGYVVEEELARGGQGVVLRARHTEFDRAIALKLLLDSDRVGGRRFEQEARVLAQLKHPNLPRVFDLGVERGVPYMAMKFIEGQTLAEVIEAEKRDGHEWSRDSSSGDSASGSRTSVHLSRSKQIARVGRDVARALEAAHAAGVLHRDIKPGNLILDDDGKIWVTDFGLAKVEHADDLTQSGSLLGTPRYMAPEAIEGWADPRTDVYGVGVSLYELLTGEPPFSGESRAELLRHIEEREPMRPRKRDPKMLESPWAVLG